MFSILKYYFEIATIRFRDKIVFGRVCFIWAINVRFEQYQDYIVARLAYLAAITVSL